MDKRAGLYTSNFYEVAEVADSEVERWREQKYGKKSKD
jgi:hypothetical protein